MKKLFLLSILLAVTCISKAQLSEQSKKLFTKDDVLYLKDSGHDFRVDTRTVTVKLKEGETLDTNNLTVQRQNKLGYIDVTVPGGMDVEKFAKELDESGIYETVELNGIGEFYSVVSNDYFRGYQDHLDIINISKAWNYTMGDSALSVAVIDKGTDCNHVDIGYGYDNYRNIENNSIWNDTIIEIHGTAIAGIISAKTNNNRGISGICGGNGGAGVKIVPYRIYNRMSMLDDAIIDATDRGVKVIQMSLGTSMTNAINSAITYAYNNGVSLVCASGNTGGSVTYPASHDKVIAVGGMNLIYQRTNSSNYGTGLDIVAPSTVIWTSVLNNQYDYVSGTSYAAPQVSGVIALMLSVNPSLSPSTIRYHLRNTAYKLTAYTYDSNGWNEEVGYGLLDAHAAVRSVARLNINGTNLICDSASYNIINLPLGATIEWELDNEYYNDSEILFRTDYPSEGQCMIVRDSHLTLNDTLTARVYDEDGTLIRTLKQKVRTRTKAEFLISVEDNSWPPVLTSASVAEDDPAKVPSGALVKMGSPRFNGMSITSSGACTYLLHSGDSVKLRTTGIASIQCINNSNCDQFTLHFYTKKKPFFPIDPPIIDDSLIIEPLALDEPKITVGRSAISIVLNQFVDNGDDEDNSQAIPLSNDVSWNISIYRYTDGKRMYDQKVQGSHIQVNTYGWDTGLYIVRIVCGNRRFAHKISL